jgi:hypothetical protein
VKYLLLAASILVTLGTGYLTHDSRLWPVVQFLTYLVFLFSAALSIGLRLHDFFKRPISYCILLNPLWLPFVLFVITRFHVSEETLLAVASLPVPVTYTLAYLRRTKGNAPESWLLMAICSLTAIQPLSFLAAFLFYSRKEWLIAILAALLFVVFFAIAASVKNKGKRVQIAAASISSLVAFAFFFGLSFLVIAFQAYK